MRRRGLTVKDRLHQRVGRLVVIQRMANRQEGGALRACWLCRCDCGNSIIVTGHALGKGLSRHGGTRSCGCLLREKPIKHGMRETKVYRCWHMMVQRCTNPKNAAFHRYGGRGILVCEAWRDFRNFYADMGDPSPTQSIDRTDNNLGYFKENCRWATRLEQGNNRMSNKIIEFNGRSQTLSQWAKETSLGKACLWGRIMSGWSIERALTVPKMFSRSSQ